MTTPDNEAWLHEVTKELYLQGVEDGINEWRFGKSQHASIPANKAKAQIIAKLQEAEERGEHKLRSQTFEFLYFRDKALCHEWEKLLEKAPQGGEE